MFLARMAHAECRVAPVDASGSASERSERCVSPPGGGVGRPSLRDGCVGKGARTEPVVLGRVPGSERLVSGRRQRFLPSKTQSSGAERHRPSAGGSGGRHRRTRPSLGPRILQSSSRFAESPSSASDRGGPVRLPSGTRAPRLKSDSTILLLAK